MIAPSLSREAARAVGVWLLPAFSLCHDFVLWPPTSLPESSPAVFSLPQKPGLVLETYASTSFFFFATAVGAVAMTLTTLRFPSRPSFREDINSVLMTVMQGLLEKYSIDPAKIGRLEVREQSQAAAACYGGKRGASGGYVGHARLAYIACLQRLCLFVAMHMSDGGVCMWHPAKA